MSIAKYLASINECLITTSFIQSYEIIKERDALIDGYLRARLTFIDGSYLEFAEYTQLQPDDSVNVVTYSYHWVDARGNLVYRWDNTPHFPKLPGFPHHLHIGPKDSVEPNPTMDIFKVLQIVSQQFADK